jgi:hypothetical protein
MRQLTHDVRQRSHHACADPKISSWRPLVSSRSHQEAEHKANCDNRQCDDNEAGEDRREHVSLTIHHRDAEIERTLERYLLCVSMVNTLVP